MTIELEQNESQCCSAELRDHWICEAKAKCSKCKTCSNCGSPEEIAESWNAMDEAYWSGK